MAPSPDNPPPHTPDPQRPDAALLRWAYAHGLFPMADSDTGEIGWYSPDPRGIIPLDEFHVPRNLARAVRASTLTIRCDTCFERVMRECGRQRDDDGGTWIDERLITAFTELYDQGAAHSIEAFAGPTLVGGLYGAQLSGAFFGESMFSRPESGGTNSSKICLVHLVRHLRERGFRLLDTQFWNPHLEQFGCIEIPRRVYLGHLDDAVAAPATWGEFV